MPANLETVHQIMKERNAVHDAFEKLYTILQNEVREMRRNALLAGRKLTKKEKKRWDEIVTLQQKYTGASIEMDYITLVRLDNSTSLKAIKKRMDGINTGLGDSLKKLKKIEKYAETAKKIASTLESIIAKLAVL